MRLGNLTTNKSWPDSLRDLQEELRKWSIEEDFILPIKRECEQAGRVKVSFAIHGNWVHPECNRWQRSHGADWLERNLRAIVLAIQSARLADQRGIGSLLAEVTRVTGAAPGQHPSPYSPRCQQQRHNGGSAPRLPRGGQATPPRCWG